MKNTLAASLLLFTALLSVSSAAKAVPPDPLPGTPPLTTVRVLAAKATPPDPMPGNPPLTTVRLLAAKAFPPEPMPGNPPLALVR
ncbi:MAG TPA: hypothetical protein VHU83_25190 [Bryobacteraceae bacterium]|nr:hypothetical protein [Bryobacteraceae bacterium]